MQTNGADHFAFATFVFKPGTGELTSLGRPVRINQQIADLLTLFVENPDRVITREEIKDLLWPDQSFLNQDKLITNAVSRLRFLLGDRSTTSPYIVNLPKRGYRLAVEVSRVPLSPDVRTVEPVIAASAPDPAPGPTVAAIEAVAAALPEPHNRLPTAGLPTTRTTSSRRLWLWTVAATLLLLVAAGAFLWSRHRPAQVVASETVSVGIPPFETSGDARTKELAESFRLDLTDSLAGVPHIAVRAAHSLEQFDTESSDFRQRAATLGLDTLVLGRFQLQGERCHLELELVHGRDLTHIVTLQYSAPRDQLARLRDQVQHELPERLSGTSHTAGSDRAKGTSNDAAYDAYLRGGYHLSQPSTEAMRLALKEYQQALQLDPTFSQAYARQSRAYFLLEQAGAMPEDESMALAQESARKALELDPNSAEAHSMLGFIRFFHFSDLAGGEKEMLEAVRLDPSQAFYRQGLALLYCDEGQFTKALAELDVAHANDPFWVSAYITDAHVSGIAGDATRLNKAITKLRELAPDSARAQDSIGNAEWNLGRYADAIQQWQNMAVEEGDKDRADMERRGMEAFRRGGIAAYGRVRLDAIKSGKGIDAHPNDFVAAEWYPVAGEREQALAAIQDGITRHRTFALSLAVLPNYGNLRNDPAFQNLVNQAGLKYPVTTSTGR